MPQYCVAKSFPSGVGSEKAISSLLKYEPYMKLLLFKRGEKKKIKRELLFRNNARALMLLSRKPLLRGHGHSIGSSSTGRRGLHLYQTARTTTPSGRGFIKPWYFRRNVHTEQFLASCVDSSISGFKKKSSNSFQRFLHSKETARTMTTATRNERAAG